MKALQRKLKDFLLVLVDGKQNVRIEQRLELYRRALNSDLERTRGILSIGCGETFVVEPRKRRRNGTRGDFLSIDRLQWRERRQKRFLAEKRTIFVAKKNAVRLAEKPLDRPIGRENFADRIAAIRRVMQTPIVREEEGVGVAARTDAKMFADEIEATIFRRKSFVVEEEIIRNQCLKNFLRRRERKTSFITLPGRRRTTDISSAVECDKDR